MPYGDDDSYDGNSYDDYGNKKKRKGKNPFKKMFKGKKTEKKVGFDDSDSYDRDQGYGYDEELPPPQSDTGMGGMTRKVLRSTRGSMVSTVKMIGDTTILTAAATTSVLRSSTAMAGKGVMTVGKGTVMAGKGVMTVGKGTLGLAQQGVGLSVGAVGAVANSGVNAVSSAEAKVLGKFENIFKSVGEIVCCKLPLCPLSVDAYRLSTILQLYLVRKST
jgi:hypothetical protein